MKPALSVRKKELRFCRSECIYLFGCFLVYMLWSVLFTGDRYGPDEVYRELVPRFIYLNGGLPSGFEDAVRIKDWGFSYAYYMSLPYLTSALFMKLMSLFSSSAVLLRIACRFSSVLSGVGTAFYSIRITKRITASPFRWVFIVIMTLLPQIVFLSSYFNLDAFSLMTVMMIIDAWIDGIQSCWSRRSCIALAMGMGLCFLSYKFAWSYILCSFLLYVVWYAINRKVTYFKDFLCKGMLILCITFAICGWVFIRCYRLYDGDFLALRQNDIYGELYAIDVLKPSLRDTFRNRGESMVEMLKDSAWLKITGMSFICGLGYLDIFPEWPYFYRLFDVIGVASATGLFCLPFLKKTEEAAKNSSILQWVVPFVFIASAITFYISVYYSWSMDWQPQGRYLICALPLFASFVSCGLWSLTKTAEMLLPPVIKRTEKTKLPQLVSAGVCLWIVASTYLGFDALISAFL